MKEYYWDMEKNGLMTDNMLYGHIVLCEIGQAQKDPGLQEADVQRRGDYGCFVLRAKWWGWGSDW